MTSEEVRALVEREIGGDWSRSNAHGCDLRQCLVTPRLAEYDDGSIPRPPDTSRWLVLWLVLEEFPEDPDRGYKIVYSEQHGMFGLAVENWPRDTIIGFYGSFFDTYDSM